MAADYLALYRAVRRAAAAFRLPRPALSPAVEAPVAAGEAPVPAGEYGGPANGRSGFTGGARRANDLGESGHL